MIITQISVIVVKIIAKRTKKPNNASNHQSTSATQTQKTAPTPSATKQITSPKVLTAQKNGAQRTKPRINVSNHRSINVILTINNVRMIFVMKEIT